MERQRTSSFQPSTETTRASQGRGRDADHDIADLLPRLDVPIGLDDLVQPIAPVDERPERPRLEYPPEVSRHPRVVPPEIQHDLLAATHRGDERQEQVLGQGPNSDER